MITLGVDCHKHYSFVVALNAQGKFLMEAKLSNNKEQFARLLENFNEPCQAVIETGYTWGLMYDLLSELGVKVTVAHALKVKAIASAKIKTDKIDARVLAELLWAGLIPEVYVPPKEIRQQKDILRQRCWLVKSKTAIKNRVHQILARNHIENLGFSDIFGAGGRKFLLSLSLNGPDQDILRQDINLYDFINEQIKITNQWIEKSLQNNRHRVILLSVPGFGPILSALAALEITDIQRFSHPGKLSSYSGLVPSTYASGGKVFHGDLITYCNHWLRYAFVEAAWSAVSSSTYFRALYYRIKKNKGSNTAIVAVARKLSEITYCCLKENRLYEERPYYIHKKLVV